MRITKKQTVTYLGKRCTTWQELERGKDGPRYVHYEWIDDADPRSGGWPAGSHVVKKVAGSVQRGTFAELEPERRVDIETPGRSSDCAPSYDC